ncbi:hypothetical protein SAMN05660236_1864 [Ohtaekwangia koreensis]|uniref:Type IV leader peptidase family protein n=1 Tax=Ohtaekwangia koreensis TaxID=688867 RepID=A0A1T5K677_9BACT|nr:hypothetical protein SAMN05660236_1864 [Ohtaekwangia koreensis]
MLWFKFLVAGLLLSIAYEDFKNRMVRLVFYLLLVASLIILRFDNISLIGLLIDFGMNLAYLSLLLFMSLTVLYLRYKKITNPLLYIGVGDILLLLIFCIWFDTINFVVFNTVSLIVALIAHSLLKQFEFYNKHKTIPLAGIQSLCFLSLLIIRNIDAQPF